MKKLIASIVLSGTLVAGACATVGCSTGDGSSARTDDGVQITLSDDMRNACDFYAYGAASVGSIVAANAARTTEAEGESSVVDGTADGQTETDEDETQIDEGDADSDNAVMPDEDTDFDSAWAWTVSPKNPTETLAAVGKTESGSSATNVGTAIWLNSPTAAGVTNIGCPT